MNELLTPAEMQLADQFTIANGVKGIVLMEAAGDHVAKAASRYLGGRSNIIVVCSIGNNGGDGFVAGRILREQGHDVFIHIVGSVDQIKGDALLAYDSLGNATKFIEEPDWNKCDLIIDALFGAGLARNLEGQYRSVVQSMNACPAPIISVDLPSGINGETGAKMGVAVQADETVTFFRAKPGHFLLPGREHCGKLNITQIGIDDAVLSNINVQAFHNTPTLWAKHIPTPAVVGHKYSRGHTLAVSGDLISSSAARLMAGAALRIGSGLVTIASPDDALVAHASQINSIMLKEINSPEELAKILEDQRLNCVAMGPGLPPDAGTRVFVKTALFAKRKTVLDAGALSAFTECPNDLFDLIGEHQDVVLTPHEGEFFRLFPDLEKESSKLEMARIAAQRSSACIVFKGSDTVVAAPDGQASICDNAPAYLATAGSGDVLSGMVAGLVAQDTPLFMAASAAVWFHGDAASRMGPPLISSDLDQGLRMSLGNFFIDYSGFYANRPPTK